MSNSEIDYEKLGFKSGLEIHQQLNTKSKLFCNCPCILRSGEPSFIFKRKLNIVSGESGGLDPAAVYESKLDKEFIYESYDTTCLVEMDEEPPYNINKEALIISLQISLLLNCKIIPISQIMRKTVINGSNTSGFQRTVLIACNGWIETEKGKVGIESICLEEDSARIVNKEKNIFRIDRLGIPLVEITTKPDIKNPGHAKEIALKIGNILRKCDVKRGIGTIRQDVNLSLFGGSRVELKGFQDIKNIEKAMEIEVKRQIKLIKKSESIPEVRNVFADGTSKFLRPLPGSSRMYPETDVPLLKISRDLINQVKKKTKESSKNFDKEYLENKGLNKEMISLLLKKRNINDFKELLSIIEKPSIVCKVLFVFPKEISKKKNLSLDKIEKILNNDVVSEVLEKMKKGFFQEGNLKKILEDIVDGKSLEEACSFEKVDFFQVEEFVLKTLKEKPGLNINAYMGLVMKQFKGRISGKEVKNILNKFIKEN